MSTLSEKPFRLTHKQRVVLTMLHDAVELDIDQMMDEVEARGEGATKQAMQSTLRVLINRGLISKRGKSLRRGRWRPTYLLKERGRLLIVGDVVIEGDPPEFG